MPITLRSFDEALRASQDGKRHLMVGNGFSIALFPDRFRYDSLLENTDFSESPEIREAFAALNTTDFETVIKTLRAAVMLMPIYSEDDDLARQMHAHAEILKELLVRAIAGKHPERPSDISEDQYKACRKFLTHFVGTDRDGREEGRQNLQGQIYTLNYDLLLYWTMLHDDPIDFDDLESTEEQVNKLKHDDGFRAPEDDPDAPYVTWDAEGGASDGQNVHCLHGALHLYDDGPDLQKKCWERSGGIPLVEQIRQALAVNKFPLFVSEGNSRGKLEKIRHSGYLQRSLKSFAAICRSPNSSLFIFGHSLDPNDDHIIKHIAKGKIRNIYVSLYGDVTSDMNRAIITRAQNLALARHARNPLEITFFSAESALVWG